MRIGLITDTHIPEAAQEVPLQIAEVFRGVDLILHAGDVYVPSVLDDLERIAPVLVAMGDDDPYAIRKDKRAEDKHVLKLEGHTIWLIHERPDSKMFELQEEENSAPDIVVFGHEHTTHVQRYGRVLFINPGSPTFLHYRLGLGTVGILNINSHEAQASILHL